MQHDSQNCDDVAPPAARQSGLRSCPVPPDVLKARNDHQKYLELLDMINSIEQTPIPRIEKEDPPADAEATYIPLLGLALNFAGSPTLSLAGLIGDFSY